MLLKKVCHKLLIFVRRSGSEGHRVKTIEAIEIAGILCASYFSVLGNHERNVILTEI